MTETIITLSVLFVALYAVNKVLDAYDRYLDNKLIALKEKVEFKKSLSVVHTEYDVKIGRIILYQTEEGALWDLHMN